MAEINPTQKPSGTNFTWQIRKPHCGLLQFVIVFPDANYWVWRQIEFHDANKINSNVGPDSPNLPANWFVETVAQRRKRLTT